ncbi:MAG: hypothetical protein RBU23_09530 [Candidatus Auribacterota bacterium]|jgi:hypothetical protein|nr:hypothetical protein [Candidatus Auribacterota bacterium]
MKELKEKFSYENDGHVFKSYDWDNSDGWKDELSNKLIPLIQNLYADLESLKKDLEETGWDEKEIKKHIDEVLNASIPSDTTDSKIENFQVRRADFAELIATICLEELYNTKIPLNNILHRELTHKSGRGIDIFGYEEVGNNICLILCEIKGSKDSNSPPSVVGDSEDSMKQQLFSYVTDKKKTLDRIINIRKKSTNINDKKTLTKISMLWTKEDESPLKVIACPFLVRDGNCYKNTDFGFFKENPDHFAPAKIRFLIVCIHDDIVELSKQIYNLARESA